MANASANVSYRTISWLEGYRFGSDGTVWSAWTRSKNVGTWGGTQSFIGEEWKIMNPKKDNGYLRIILRIDKNKYKLFSLHRLILEAFVGPCPEGMECRHLDGNRMNNRIENLKWGTRSENGCDRTKHGTGGKKLKKEDVVEIRRLAAEGMKQTEICKIYGLNTSTVSDIVLMRSWINM